MSDARPASASGELIAGKYRVERIIAEGGMGVVVEATHVALGQRLAVKLLRVAVTDEQDAVARLLEEARTVAQLPADHVARAVDAGQTDDGRPYFVMELLVGRDLDEELRARGRLPVREAVAYVLQACEGVAEAHAVGLVHRDLKPANVFLARRRDGSPLVKVLDFGVASWVRAPIGMMTPSHDDRMLCGTPAYMAPEQFTSATVDARCDQYALAVMLYELLTGSPPFAAPSVHDLRILVRRAPPPPLRELRADVPAALAHAVLRALAKDPDHRFADVAAFASAIARYGGEPGIVSAHNVAFVLGRTSGSPRLGRAPRTAAVVERTTAAVERAGLCALRAARSRTSIHSAVAGAVAAVALVGWCLDGVTPVRAAGSRGALGLVSSVGDSLSPPAEPANDEPPLAVVLLPHSSTALAVPEAQRPTGASSLAVAALPEAQPPAPKTLIDDGPSTFARPARRSAREVFGARR